MKRNRPSAFYSTAQGQLTLMRESVGQNYEGLDTPVALRQPAPLLTAARVPVPEHPLVGRSIRATWHVGRLREFHEGVVLKVDAVSGSKSLRLVLSFKNGNTIRCYTDDPQWTIELLRVPAAVGAV